MFAPGADKVGGKLLAFVDIAANFANVAFFIFCFGFGFDMAVVVTVGHAFFFCDYFGFGDTANEHTVSAYIHILLYFKREKGIDKAREYHQAVGRTLGGAISKLIH